MLVVLLEQGCLFRFSASLWVSHTCHILTCVVLYMCGVHSTGLAHAGIRRMWLWGIAEMGLLCATIFPCV